MTKKQKKRLKKIIVSLVLFIATITANFVLLLGFNGKYPLGLSSIIGGKFGFILPLVLYLVIYIIIGKNILKKCLNNVKNGQVFDENFLMVIATFGAFLLGIINGLNQKESDGFMEAVAVLIFFEIGEFLQNYAVSSSKKSISSLLNMRPDFARVITSDGENIVDPESVNIGDIISVYSGEKIPLDGVVIEGNSLIDEKALTGESYPKSATINSEVISGTINLSSKLNVRVSKTYKDGTVSKILQLVEDSSSKKSKTENFITTFCRYYTPTVVFLALFVAIVPSIITKDFATYFYRALNFLVVSCPCALVISIPLTFFTSIGYASKKGVLIKGSGYLEILNKANVFVFDKTGTITKGNFKVAKYYPEEKKDELLRLASICESGFSHPIALSILKECNFEVENGYTVTSVFGKGNVAIKNDTVVLCGNASLLNDYGVFVKDDSQKTTVHIAKNGLYIGYVAIEDEIKEDSLSAISYLNSIGAKTVMLTGDKETTAKSVASLTNISEFKCELLPQQKVEETETLIKNNKKGGAVCFVGDGINDAPVLMRADVGISMGGIGSDASLEASDVVLMKDKLSDVVFLKKLAKKTARIVRQNVVFIITVKSLILILSTLGYSNMFLAILGDVGVSLVAILNALRSKK